MHKNKVLKSPKYQVGFYLLFLLFVEFLNNKQNKESPLKDFKHKSFEKQIKTLKKLKQILKQTYSAHQIGEIYGLFKKIFYSLRQEEIIKQILQVEENLHTESRIVKEYF